MKKSFMTGCIIIFVLVAFALTATAGELYVWVDKKGQTHVTDQPPPENARIIGTDSFRKNSTVETESQVPKQNRPMMAPERVNSIRIDAAAIAESNREREEKREAAEAKRKKERIDDLNARKEILNALENREYDEARRLRYKSEQRRLDRGLEKSTE